MQTSSAAYYAPKVIISIGTKKITVCQSRFGNGYFSSSSLAFSAQKLSRSLRKSVIVEAKKKNKKEKTDTHSFVPKPDEATGPFPESVLLKEKKVNKDGRLLPEFADAEEEELFEYLNLQLESDLNMERMRHYEVVYLVHEDNVEEVDSVKSRIEGFLREKKGKIWRLNEWGLRRLAYKIKKAKNAYYILMNFELEAKWINDFKSMLDKDERVIRHLVIKRDEAITEDCAPPPEFHTLRSDMDDDDGEEDDEMDYNDTYEDEDDGEDWDDEGDVAEDWDHEGDDGEDDLENYDDDAEEDNIIHVNGKDNGRSNRTANVSNLTKKRELRK